MTQFSTSPGISAYVPVWNNSFTLAQALASIRQQTLPVTELLVIDDGSTDNSATIAEQCGARVIRHERNLGRGAVRARALQEARHELVLSCDAAIVLPPSFCALALPWLTDPQAAAVFGPVVQSGATTLVERWRARHLFKADAPVSVHHRASLATGGALIKRSAALAVGNFNADLRAGEDADLGGRLLAAGHEVIFDPALAIQYVGSNTVLELLQRYRRWNIGAGQKMDLTGYLRQISYAIKVMMREDLRRNDLPAALLSFICPHYLFWNCFRARPSNTPRQSWCGVL